MNRTSCKYALFALLTALLLLAAGCSTAAGTPAKEIATAPAEVTPTPSPTPRPTPTPEPTPEPTLTPEPTPTPEPEPKHVFTEVDGATYIDGVLIVNKSYPITQDYPLRSKTPETEAAYQRMKQDAAAEGLYLIERTSFRSFMQQTIIYNNYVKEHGQAAADRFSARPGYSEHHTGLAIDLNSLETAFGETPEGKWLAEHCAEYGFILRYPKDSEEITGYIYEPWHVRYVGKELAQELYLGNGDFLTLEEYFGITSRYEE